MCDSAVTGTSTSSLGGKRVFQSPLTEADPGGAEANVEMFTETQWVTMRDEIAPYPF